MCFVDSNGLAVEQLELRHAAVLDANTGLTWTNAEDRRRRQVGQLAASSTLCKNCLIRSILDPSRRPVMTPDSNSVVSRAAGAPLEAPTVGPAPRGLRADKKKNAELCGNSRRPGRGATRARRSGGRERQAWSNLKVGRESTTAQPRPLRRFLELVGKRSDAIDLTHLGPPLDPPQAPFRATDAEKSGPEANRHFFQPLRVGGRTAVAKKEASSKVLSNTPDAMTQVPHGSELRQGHTREFRP